MDNDRNEIPTEENLKTCPIRNDRDCLQGQCECWDFGYKRCAIVSIIIILRDLLKLKKE